MDLSWDSFAPKAADNGNVGWAEIPVPAGDTAKPLPPKAKQDKRVRITLNTGSAVRVEMAKIYKQMKKGEIDIAKGHKLVYALTQLATIIEREQTQVLADELADLKRQLGLTK